MPRRVAAVVPMLIALLACVPLGYILVASAAGWSTVVDGAAASGAVRVTRCPSPIEPCRGTFGYADPGGAVGAQPSGVSYDVPIVNDLRRHAIGTVVAVSIDHEHHSAYLAGGVTLLVLVGSALVCLFVIAGSVKVAADLARGRPVSLAGPMVALLLAMAFAIGLVVPIGDDTGPVPAPNAPASVQPGG